MRYFVITCRVGDRTFSKRIAAKDYTVALQIAMACTSGYVLESVRPDSSVT